MITGSLQRPQRLHGLLEVARLVRSGADLPALLEAIAATVSESLEFATVVVSLHRPAWDDFQVACVHGSLDAKAALVGQTLDYSYWEPLLDARFEHRGVQIVRREQRDWEADGGTWFVPTGPPRTRPDEWDPGDALLAPMRHSDGTLLGVISLNEPRSGRQPTDEELDVVAAMAAHAAQAIESAHEAASAERYRASLEHLLRISTELMRSRCVNTVLSQVCEAIRYALGFRRVVVELADREADRYRPVASAGLDLAQHDVQLRCTIEELDSIFDPAFEVDGCYLCSREDALARVSAEPTAFASRLNGRGPRAWNRHWLLVPLENRAGERIGFIWADDPEDRLLPSRDRLQALRMFAIKAAQALDAAAQVETQRAVVEASPLALITLDRAGIVTSWNPEAERMLGWSAEEAIGRPLPHVPPERRGETATLLERALGGESSTGVELSRVRRDGTPIATSLSTAPIRDASGQVVGVMSAIEDVTQRRRDETDLARRNAELEGLHETTLGLLDRLDREEVLQAIVDRAGELVGTPHGYVYLVDDEADDLVMAVAAGRFEEYLGVRIPRGDGLSGRVWTEGRARAIDDYAAWDGRAAAFERPPFRANAAVPLTSGSGVIGVLGLAFDEPGRTFDAAEVALLERFGRLAALALENARLYEDVRKSRELYRKVVETSTDLIALVSAADGSVLFASPSYEQVLGYTPDELLGRPLVDLVHPDDLERVAGAVDRGPDLHLARLRHKDGRWIEFEGAAARILDDHGRPEMVLTIARDVTERRRQEEELRESRELYRSVVENATDLIALIDPDGRILYASPSHLDVLGYEPEEFVGRPVRLRVHPDDERVSEATMAATLEHGESPYTLRLQHKAGHWVVVEGRAKLLRDPDGRARMVHSTARDVTVQRALEEQLRQAQKMEAIGRLAGGIAHDFNNLLTAIGGSGELALAALPRDSLARRHVQEMTRAGDRAAALTRQLLAFSRRQVLQPVVLDLNDVVAGMEGMLARLLGEDIELSVALASDLGRTRADRGQVEQVLMNLAVNARDAMPRGGRLTLGTANVELDEGFAETHVGGRAGSYVLLSVTDTGEGMDRETLARVFEPFFTTKPAGQGTGLGLSTAYGIVKQSDGQIWAYSEPGHGTTFKVYLPRVWEEVGAGRREDRPAAEAPASETVILVEDEEIVREIVVEMLEAAGYSVLAAAGGEEALDAAASFNGVIDALITDVVMPGMSGQEVAARLTADRPNVRVVFTSGYTEDAISNHGVLSPGTAFLEKPFSAARLRETLRGVLAA